MRLDAIFSRSTHAETEKPWKHFNLDAGAFLADIDTNDLLVYSELDYQGLQAFVKFYF